MVYEKANVVFSRSLTLLRMLGLIVIDEIHLIEDLERGPMLELLLTKILAERDNLQASEGSDRRLRVVTISTEQRPSPWAEKFLKYQEAMADFGKETEPLVFHCEHRSGTQTHYFVMPTVAHSPGFKLLPITVFHSDSDRRFDRDKRSKLESACYELEKTSPQFSNKQRVREEHNQRLVNLVAALLNQHESGYRLLLFVPGKQMGIELARRIKKLVPSRYSVDDFAFPPSVVQPQRTPDLRAALKLTERKDLVRELTELAEHGVFLHHSDLPPALRECVERICGTAPTKGSQVIVATETLSYGVNLAINDVVLAGVEFIASDRRGRVRHQPLSSSAFHNMAGRAGRLGKSGHESASVYLVLPAESTRGPRTAVQNYYLKIPQERSVLYLDDDNTAAKEQTVTTLQPQLFTAPFVRCVLDALRHLNLQDIGRQERRPVPAAEVQRLLRRTLWFKEWSEKAQAVDSRSTSGKAQSYLNNLLSASQSVLDGCVAAPLRLVEKLLKDKGEPAEYRISERGEAIIDTGTEITTIEPLLRFTYDLQETWTKFRRPPVGSLSSQPPAALFLLSLLVQEQIFGDVIRYTPECYKAPNQKQRWPGTRPQQNEAAVLDQFCRALEASKISEPRALAEMLRDLLRGWKPLVQEMSNYESGAVEGVLRLFNSTVAWISGAALDDVFQLIEQVDTPDYVGMRVSSEMKNHRNFVEQLGWKIAGLTKIVFKARAADALPSELERDLLLLRERLKRGCKTEMIEFFHPRRSNLQRSEVRRLEQCGVTPAKMLAGGRTNAGLALDSRRLELLREDLIDHASDQLEALACDFSEVDVEDPARNKSNELWRGLREGGFKRSIEIFHAKRPEPYEIDQLLRECVTFSDADWQETPASASDRTVFHRTGLPAGAQDVRLAALPATHGPGVVWQQQSQPTKRLEESEKKHEGWRDANPPSRIRIVGIQAREDWMFAIDEAPFRPLQYYVTKFSGEHHLLLVCSPWLPSLDRMPPATREALEYRLARGQVTTIATPAAFATLFAALARGSAIGLDLNEFCQGHPIVAGLFFGVETDSMRRSLEGDGVLPAVLREKLLQHFEVSFEQGAPSTIRPPQS